MIELISEMYKGSISLQKPLNIEDISNYDIPEELLNLLKQSNGIKETMVNPVTGMLEEISWIIYSYEGIIEWTNFYRDTYSIEGIVFSDDDADDVYYIKPNGKIYSYNTICGEDVYVADSLQSFFTLSYRETSFSELCTHEKQIFR